ncbi:MAG: hypothetical protein NW203_13345 [Hyphomonadaceae bacterium]|nr:hypothetical protein [Hyphomonadaceae bacterium]
MKRMLALTALFTIALAGCATHETGVRDPQIFRAVADRFVLLSERPHAEVAACFQERAALLPMSAFVAASDQQIIYRLRGFGYTFEEIDFDASNAGSMVTVMIAPGVNDRWRRDFTRDRLRPLQDCAAALAS